MEAVIGSCIRHNNKLCKVVDKTHIKPGKGGAYVQMKLKTLEGVKIETRFSSSDNIEPVMIERKKYQFSYKEKADIVLTDVETYDTLEIGPSVISKNAMYILDKFISEELDVMVEFADDQIIDAFLPNAIKVKIEIADPVVKGQTAASSYKNAVIKGDISIGVPPYITSDDYVMVNPYGEKGVEFIERA